MIIFKNNKATTRSKNRKAFSDSDVDFDTDDDLPVHPKWKSSHVANEKQHSRNRGARDFGSDDDSDEEIGYNRSKKNEKRGVSKRGGGRSSFREESFSGTDSDDGDRQRGNNAYGGRGQGRGRGRGSGGRGGERMDDRRSSMNRGFDRSSGKRNNGDFRESSYNGRDGKFSKPRGGDRKQGRGGGSFGKRGGGRGGGRSNRFDDGDSYEHEESNLRPRANVR
ncbi:PREDICTED: protein argonaute 18-like [Erythranthe guttata]|nr:PREDICTED: protein argonaute 18-like [Erythranthe guttata]|eukprot:XP_012831549.1 PREDICTED: protein argonaute 18-like [Erythranthe guttata]